MDSLACSSETHNYERYSRARRHMKLAPFIRANIEAIAAEWERFAATLLPEENFSVSLLRDDIVDILNDVAADMDRDQSAEQQQKKSEGDPEDCDEDLARASVRHAVARVRMNFSLQQLIAEFRALRATVIRLWRRSSVEIDNESLDDLTRFNEAIDQLIAEGAIKHTQEIERSRELFLGILGHDLRNPLGAISGLAELQLRAKTPERAGLFASQILTSARRMSHIIDDLIGLARVRLGSGIDISPAPGCMRRICTDAVEEMRAIYPKRVFQMDSDAELPGEWDEAKLSQVLSNLLGNAVQHGASNSPVTVTAKSNGNEVEVAVHNKGAVIPSSRIPRLFDSFFQAGEEQKADDSRFNSLGLGLYISKEIVQAHGGTIDVRSSDDEGTTFIVRLPSRRG
jgi:signal transduction histidine kinase